ncbi:MAG: NAD(P)H-dependent oxidoreductase [Candidatus Bathyarchaeota archaeon]|nr:NAD(P)H-dependent oxidoreductase [Candidatus Bathyarchaeota archaeon]
MKVVVLNGARSTDAKADEVSEAVVSTLSDAGEVAVFKLREMQIADCIGCYGCWIKTPAECIINDSARGIAKKLAFADLKVFVTPIVFGGYSYELKKALDRQICTIMPFFTKINGEVHHEKRYEHNGSVVGFGVLPQPDAESEKIFETLLMRNSINLHAPAHASKIVYSTDDSTVVAQKIKETLTEVGTQ